MHGIRRAFLEPQREYAPWPFWFWNDRLEDEELLRQMDDFTAHGVGGVVIHPRMGLPADEPYLSPAFMAHVERAVRHAADIGLNVMLYDEGMYPSGSAHGEVVRENPAWASRGLFLRDAGSLAADERLVAEGCIRVENGRLAGWMDSSAECPPGWRRVMLVDSPTHGTIRGVHPGEDDGEPNAPPSADLLNPEAVEAFIRYTHEIYYAALSPWFGKVIRAFFTDEPNIVGRNAPTDCLPWTEGFLSEYGLQPRELASTLVNRERSAEFEDAVNRRLNHTYYAKLAAWCEAHGVALTGHPAASGDLTSEKHFTWPGQDLVWRTLSPENNLSAPDSVQGRCAASAALLAGRERVADECFGCCGPQTSQWGLTMDNLKWYTDWLLVRGVNLLVPHAFFYSIREERAGERPPDVGPNNTLWPFWKSWADYCARLCAVSALGKEEAAVGIVTDGCRLPLREAETLLTHQTPFVYLAPEHLTEAEIDGERALRIGGACLKALILPAEVSLNRPAAEKLAAFLRAGGQLLSAETAAERFAALRAEPACPDLRVLPLTAGEERFFLLTNEGEEAIHALISLPVSGQTEAWNAWSGEISQIRTEQGSFWLSLGRRESLLVHVDPDQPETAPSKEMAETELRVKRPWVLHRPDGGTQYLAPGPDGRLPDWTALDGLARYSGPITYETVLTLTEPLPDVLDLGEAREYVRLWVNGKDAGERLWGPWRFRVKGLLRKGVNHLRAEVTNTPANRVDQVFLPSGLIGG